MKYCSQTGRRNHGRPLKRHLDTWDRNGSSGPPPWKIFDDDFEESVLILNFTWSLPKFMQIYIEDYTGWCWNLCRYVDVHTGRYWSSSSLILKFVLADRKIIQGEIKYWTCRDWNLNLVIHKFIHNWSLHRAIL